ncbi:hypothetical protein MMC16_000260 [Acarospora aff. strigata]|nr:hypothetical protein [Acarospora aff. strigata]
MIAPHISRSLAQRHQKPLDEEPSRTEMSTSITDHLLICTACGTQFSNTSLKNCRICDDPRQFVPPSGQSFTTLAEMKGKYKNKWQQDSVDKRIWSIWTEPKFGIGQRAILLQTPAGNVLWDLIAYLDGETVQWINSLGPLHAIIVSHPHYYTTHAHWSSTFHVPIYTSAADALWLEHFSNDVYPDAQNKFVEGDTEEIVKDVTAIRTGGHFEGSLVLHWEGVLFVADTVVTVPSALYHTSRPPGTTSYSFMYSIPNMIPLPPDEILQMWKALKAFEFSVTMGAFVGMDVRDTRVKERVLESMKIQVRAMGWGVHGIFAESC